MTEEDKSPAPKPQDGSVSLEDLDSLINQVDPGFNASLEAIKNEAVTDTSAIETLQVDSQVDVGNEDEAHKSTFKQKVLSILAWPFIKVRDWLLMRWMAFKNRAVLFKDQSVQFFKHELPERLRYYRSLLYAGFNRIKGQIQLFISLSLAQKLAALASAAFVGAAFFFLVQSFRGQWLPTWRNPIMANFAQHAAFVRHVKNPKDYVRFFEAFPDIEIPFLLSKIVVNLTPSAGIPNPMGAFEFYLGLDSKETAIEIKDREKEMLDLVQRTVEEFTYDEVMGQIGQVRMKARIRDALNKSLRQGRVTKVYISTMVTKR